MHDVVAEKRCELCGALVTPEGIDHHRPEMAELADFMAWFLSLSVTHRNALSVFVQMALFPNNSIASCASRCGISRQRAVQLLAALERQQPLICSALASMRAMRPACGSQQERRLLEAYDNGKQKKSIKRFGNGNRENSQDTR